MKDHSRADHNPDCHIESTNVFAELDAKRQIDWYRSEMQKDKEDKSEGPVAEQKEEL